MEENNNFTYEDYFPEYEDVDVLTRFFYPGIAELSELGRESYLQDKGNAFNEYMFNKANEYNSAKAQMQRAKEAGINPMLAAAGIVGTGGTATPMPSQSASVGMNQQGINPFDTANTIFNALDKGMDTTDKLGKLLGFGKENKANLKIAEKTAEKIQTDLDLNKIEYFKIKRTLKAYIKETEANASKAEQDLENLRALYEKYKAEKELIEKQKDLVTEEENTQKQLTKTQEYKNWELEIKKQFREMFGVLLNESDTSMLTQLLLNGKGDKVIDALAECLRKVFQGLGRNTEEIWQPVKDKIKDATNYTIDAHDRFKQQYREKKSERVTRREHKRFERALQTSWNYMGSEARKKYNYDYYKFRKEMIKKRQRKGYSGRWYLEQ